MVLVTDCWELKPGQWVLYTENAHAARLAREAGLKLMAQYYRGDRLLALQFTGPREVVKALAGRAYPPDPVRLRVSPGPRRAKCHLCGKRFTASGNRQVYCPGCRQEAERRATRERVRKYRATRPPPPVTV